MPVTGNPTLEQPLFAAVASGDVFAVKNALERGASINAHDPDSGLTPLMMAAGYGFEEVTLALLAAGADPFVCDSRAGGFALHKAAQQGSVSIARHLLDAGLFIDCRCATTGHTPLIDAIWFKKAEVVELFLDRNARTDVKTNYGFTLEDHLEYGLKVNQKPSEQALLMRIKGCLEKRKRHDEQIARDNLLVAATLRDDTSEVKELIADGANLEMRTPMLGNFNDDHTALLLAVRDGHDGVASLLIDAGADTNAQEPTFMSVPLHKATYNGRAAMTRVLANSKGTNIDFQGLTNGYTPLHDALWHGFEECARILIEAGANLHLRGHDGKLPVDVAIETFGEAHELTKFVRLKMESR